MKKYWNRLAAAGNGGNDDRISLLTGCGDTGRRRRNLLRDTVERCV